MGLFVLECWTCGLKTMVSGPQPEMGVHLMLAAQSVEWKSMWGDASVRVFCSDACCDMGCTKKGTLRRNRPRNAPKRSKYWDPENNANLPAHMYPPQEES